MRVIENNKLVEPKKYPKRIECEGCKSVLEIEENDFIQEDVQDYQHELGFVKTTGVLCLICNRFNPEHKFKIVPLRSICQHQETTTKRGHI